MTRLLRVWSPRARARPEPPRHNGERVSQFEGKKKEITEPGTGSIEWLERDKPSRQAVEGGRWGFRSSESARTQGIDYNLRRCVTVSVPEADKMKIAPFPLQLH